MKYLITLLTAFPLLTNAADEIQPKTKVIKSAEWYISQSNEWRQIIENDPNNAAAWLNYYAALRYAGPQYSSEITQLAEDAEKHIAGTFEGRLIHAWQAGYGSESFDELQNAQRQYPNRTEGLGLATLLAEFNLSAEWRKVNGARLLASGQLSQSLLNYSYNVLMSVEDGAILLTEGDHATLPLLVLQDVFAVRKDVVVGSLDMLTHQTYLAKFLQDHTLQLRELNPGSKEQLCKELPLQNPGFHFYYTLTMDKNNVAPLQENLYVTGLVSQFSPARFDNLKLLQENIEQKFLLDYLTVDFNGEEQSAAGKVLSSNYLVPFILLHEQYQSNDAAKSVALERLITKIATETGRLRLVNNFLQREQISQIPYVPYSLEVKDVEDHFRLVRDNIYAANTETTNQQFNDFLAYLKINNLNELYEKFQFDLSSYEEPALSMMKNYTAARITTKKEKYFTNYPAVSISFEAANAYCEWLTDQYNNQADRKFKKVKFRLPTINEWQISAYGVENVPSWNPADVRVETKKYPEDQMTGKNYESVFVTLDDPEVNYPWFKHYRFRNTVVNQKGCYLGNFKVPDDVTPCWPEKMVTADGFLMMSPVRAYFPNDIGLYDVVGNVAEMSNEKGKALGGSWNHLPEDSKIKSINAYDGPSYDVGFRIFMEVIEK